MSSSVRHECVCLMAKACSSVRHECVCLMAKALYVFITVLSSQMG